MKKLFSIILILFSVIVQAQNLKTTVDNSLLNQGTKGITALKVRNTLNTIVDSIRLKEGKLVNATNTERSYLAEDYLLIAGNNNGEAPAVARIKNWVSFSQLKTDLNAKPTIGFVQNVDQMNPTFYSMYDYVYSTSEKLLYKFVKGTGFLQDRIDQIGENIIPESSNIDKLLQTQINSKLEITAAANYATQNALNAKLSLSGGTMTGDLRLNNVVKVGGSSTFENTLLGQDVLNSVTSGTQNVGIGKNTLKAITGGSWNTGLGYSSIELGTTATKNTGIGAYSLQSLTTGQYNTAVGFEAGKDLTTGTFNTYIGAFKGTGYATSDRRIFISDGAGNVRISVTNTGNVGIGTKDATSPLQIIDLPIFSSNSSAISAGLTAGAVYRSTTGFLMIVY
jgi:hypothetical protein